MSILFPRPNCELSGDITLRFICAFPSVSCTVLVHSSQSMFIGYVHTHIYTIKNKNKIVCSVFACSTSGVVLSSHTLDSRYGSQEKEGPFRVVVKILGARITCLSSNSFLPLPSFVYLATLTVLCLRYHSRNKGIKSLWQRWGLHELRRKKKTGNSHWWENKLPMTVSYSDKHDDFWVEFEWTFPEEMGGLFSYSTYERAVKGINGFIIVSVTRKTEFIS